MKIAIVWFIKFSRISRISDGSDNSRASHAKIMGNFISIPPVTSLSPICLGGDKGGANELGWRRCSSFGPSEKPIKATVIGSGEAEEMRSDLIAGLSTDGIAVQQRTAGKLKILGVQEEKDHGLYCSAG
jgi:hypothetical protein